MKNAAGKLYFAIGDFSSTVNQYLTTFQAPHVFNEVNWKKPPKFHITLNMIGEYNEILEQISVKLLKSVSFTRFSLEVSGLDTFLSKDKHILFAKLKDRSTINSLKKCMGINPLNSLPHITLGKIGMGDKSILDDYLLSCPPVNQSIDVTEVLLMHSYMGNNNERRHDIILKKLLR